MEKHEILANDIDWPKLVRHVAQDNVIVELSDGKVPVARVIPSERKKTLAELDRGLHAIPRPGKDAEAFATDLLEGRSAFKELDDPWAS